jgi:spermidine synthase
MQPTRKGLFALLIALFFISGASGLIYEVVWLRMLIRAFGITVYAVSTVLGVFMAGLALGSVVAGRYLKGRVGLLRYYAVAEIAIGLTALLSTLAIGALPAVFARLVGGGSGALVPLVRLSMSMLVLMPTTFFMGTTLPVLSGFLGRERGELGKSVALLYASNTLGAVVGTLLSGFFLLGTIGERATALSAAALNVAVGLAALALSRPASPVEVAPPESTATAERRPLVPLILALAAISGSCALLYQVIWSRILNLVLGNSVYGFSLMLAAYLSGIAIGSAIVGRFVDRLKRPLLLFGALELATALLSLASLHVFRAIGRSYADASYTYSQIWSIDDLGRLALHAILIVFPATLMLGAIFPVACRLVAGAGESAQESVGKLYGFNTIGAIVGSLASGFIAIPLAGTLWCFVIAAIISFAIALSLFRASGQHEGFARWVSASLASAVLFIGAVSISLADPFVEVLEARLPKGYAILAQKEEPAATVTLTGQGNAHTLYINGMYVSNTGPGIGTLMMAPAMMFHPSPRKVLQIGLGVGAGLQAAVAARLDITVVELLPYVRSLFERYTPNAEVFLDYPGTRIVFNDGRNYVLSSDERFDYVLVDGTPPVFASGMVNLYSLEFAQLVKAHLTPNGIFAIWFPTTCFEADYWMVARNFADTFENISALAPDGTGGIIMLGTNAKEPLFDASLDVVTTRLASFRIPTPESYARKLMSTMLVPQSLIRSRAADHPNVTDDLPYTEFPLASFWRGLPYYKDSDFVRDLRRGPVGTSSTAL